MSGEVCFIDTETLGLDPDLNPVWEIGLILPDGTEREWQIEPSDDDLRNAHPKALEISGYPERFGSRAADKWNDVCRDLHDLIEPGVHLAGAVVSFDEERLRRVMRTYGYEPRWHYHLIDVEVLAAGWLAAGSEDRTAECGPDKLSLPWDSEELSRAVGVEPERFDRHTALGDARWAKAVYEAVMFPGADRAGSE